MRRRASCSLIRFWNCRGLIAVTALKWWWKPETLIPTSLATSLTLSGRSKSSRSRSSALPMRWAWPPEGRGVAEPAALLPYKEPVDDLSGDQRREVARLGRGVQEPNQPHHGVQQASVQRAHIH